MNDEQENSTKSGLEKLDLTTPNFTDENIARIAELFPNVVTEARDEKDNVKHAIDFDALKQELSDSIVEGPQERYHLNWPGKRKAMLAANAPINKTLRPAREESVDFDTTKNLFIEGDNLDALKLLQETYLGKVKLIYIDPPYNTGKDFIYNDNFTVDKDEYLEESGQRDIEGGRLVNNPESNGRYHSDWLSMMYPRLKLARNLIDPINGIIAISIDEHEIDNLKKIVSDIFGEFNELFQVTLLCNPKGRSQDKFIANCHEYIVGFSRNPIEKGVLNIPRTQEDISKDFKLQDNRGYYRELELRNSHREFGKHNRANLYYPFYVNKDGKVFLNNSVGSSIVWPHWNDGFEGCWTWGTDKAKRQLSELIGKKVAGEWKIYRKAYAQDEDGEATKQVKSIWTDKIFHTEKGQAVFNDLFNTKEKLFQSPKSIDLIKQLILMATKKNDIVLDFFMGSGSTAHAVMDQNRSDSLQRKFIGVQLPELCGQNSFAKIAGFNNVAEISKERIHRAGKKILEENPEQVGKLDVGFRVLKIEASNMKDVWHSPENVNQSDLLSQVDNIKPDRTSEDLLFQVLLDWGVDLTLSIARENMEGKEVLFVEENALAACFEKDISEELVKQIAARKPLRAVFRDDGFDSDATKINVEQLFKHLSPTTEVKVI